MFKQKIDEIYSVPISIINQSSADHLNYPKSFLDFISTSRTIMRVLLVLQIKFSKKFILSLKYLLLSWASNHACKSLIYFRIFELKKSRSKNCEFKLIPTLEIRMWDGIRGKRRKMNKGCSQWIGSQVCQGRPALKNIITVGYPNWPPVCVGGPYSLWAH